jgi:hypothetical protein
MTQGQFEFDMHEGLILKNAVFNMKSTHSFITKLSPVANWRKENFNNLTFKVKVIYEWKSSSVWLISSEFLVYSKRLFKFEDKPVKNNKILAPIAKIKQN